MVLGGLTSHGHRRASGASNPRSSVDGAPPDTTDADETVVDADQGNVLSHIISQLRPGADLSRVTLPTFILEPRSMLERITNFMAHPEILLTLSGFDDPVERFVAVTKFYLCGWHIKPPGVKKPLNPILGETFTGYWDYSDGTRGYYISEQTSHHPPKSSYFFMAPEHNIRIDGTLKPRSKFLGNSVGSFMEGIAIMRFTNRNERYFITQPNMYARGILFGKMKYELGDHAFVRCPELGLEADIEFKVKGWMGGTYNAIGGFIKETKSGKNLFELSGLWTGEMTIKDLRSGKKEVLFDATHAKETPPKARPLDEQTDRESQKLWKKVTEAIKTRDQNTATDEKSRIEDMQRQEAAERGEHAEWQPKLFRRTKGATGSGGPGDEDGEENLDWVIDAKIDAKSPKDITEQILAIAPILPGQKASSGQSTNRSLQQQSSQPSSQPTSQYSQQPSAGQAQQSYQPVAGQDQQSYQPASGQSAGQSQPTPHPPTASQKEAVAAAFGQQSSQGSRNYGQTDGASHSYAPQQQQREPLNTMGDLREPLQPKVSRTDSTDGHQEVFIDAEM